MEVSACVDLYMRIAADRWRNSCTGAGSNRECGIGDRCRGIAGKSGKCSGCGFSVWRVYAYEMDVELRYRDADDRTRTKFNTGKFDVSSISAGI